ncbi:MAG TPA: PTS sugar transporter subunit IIC [Bacteroidaceae bacterium]|nr:PTS sugar transporter subunit IIC [Bacteroidaceae bacterium]
MNYFIRTLSSMTYGLFASLIIGSILNIIGIKLGIPFLSETIWPAAKALTGPAIAAAIAYGLNAPTLVVLSTLIPGAIGGHLGGPVGAYLAAIAGTELGRLVSQRTKIDILITPTVTIIGGSLAGYFAGPYIQNMMVGFGHIIESATTLQPFWMSIVVAVLMGMALTLPISSAAIGIMLSLSGLAAGAATIGCSAQMIGFAVMGITVNGLGGFLSQSLGTSMLQMPNIMKNWRIWIPPTLASAISAPIATIYFHLENTPIGSGMGTSGLVGQFGTLEAMEKAGYSMHYILLSISMCHIILPAVLTAVFTVLLIKLKWMKQTDVKL